MGLLRWDGTEFVNGGTIRRWDGAEWHPPMEVAFNPSDIVDMVMWLNADTLTPSTSISTWPDQSPIGTNNPTVYGGFGQPTVVGGVLNGHNVVQMLTASGQGMRWEGGGLSGDYHIFTVARVISGGTSARLVGAIYPAGANLTAGWHGGNQAAFYDGTNFIAGGGGAAVKAVWHCAEMFGKTPTEAYFDGTYWGSDSGGSSLGSTLSLSGYSYNSPEEMTDCQIAEILIWNRKLTSDERISVAEYINTKYGVPA